MYIFPSYNVSSVILPIGSDELNLISGLTALFKTIFLVIVAKCVISGLEKQKRDIDNNPEDAKAYLEQDRQIKEAQQELKKVQDKIQKDAQTV